MYNSNELTVRDWLQKSQYNDALDIINEIMQEWKTLGKKTRRNWWDYLCGKKDGKECIVSGRKIPILRTAQIRKGYTVTSSALFNCNEVSYLKEKIK